MRASQARRQNARKRPVRQVGGHEKVEGLQLRRRRHSSKPFALAELVARLRALTRGRGQKQITAPRGDPTLDTRSWVAAGDPGIELTNLEFRPS